MKTIGVIIGKVKTGFPKLPEPNLLTKALDIYKSMNGNTNFPTPTPDLLTLQAAITAYQDALTDAQSRDRSSVALKNQVRLALITMLNNLAAYVNFTGNGDIPVLATSGFDLFKISEPVTVQKPEKVNVTAGPNPGELTTSTRGSKGARSFVHQHNTNATMPDNGWVSTTTTAKTYTFTGLAKGQEYWVRVAAVGSKGQVMYSDPISLSLIHI